MFIDNLQVNELQKNVFHLFCSDRYNFIVSIFSLDIPTNLLEEFLYFANKPQNTKYVDFWSKKKLFDLLKEERYFFLRFYNIKDKKTATYSIIKKFLKSNDIKIESGFSTSVGVDFFTTFFLNLYFSKYYCKLHKIDFIEFYTRDSCRLINKIAQNANFELVRQETSEFVNNVYRYYV